jgi:hypothetical protein
MNPLIELNDNPDAPIGNPTVSPVAQIEPLTLEQIDGLIADYEYAQACCKLQDAQFDEIKRRLVTAVDSLGQVPPHAEQSRRLSGRHNIATVTRGTTITVNEGAVLVFKTYLADQGHIRLFQRFFLPQEKHALVEGARDVLKTLTLPRRVEEKIASLFGRAFDVKSKSPSLKVELVKPEKPAKQSRGKKAA